MTFENERKRPKSTNLYGKQNMISPERIENAQARRFARDALSKTRQWAHMDNNERRQCINTLVKDSSVAAQALSSKQAKLRSNTEEPNNIVKILETNQKAA